MCLISLLPGYIPERLASAFVSSVGGRQPSPTTQQQMLSSRLLLSCLQGNVVGEGTQWVSGKKWIFKFPAKALLSKDMKPFGDLAILPQKFRGQDLSSLLGYTLAWCLHLCSPSSDHKAAGAFPSPSMLCTRALASLSASQVSHLLLSSACTVSSSGAGNMLAVSIFEKRFQSST